MGLCRKFLEGNLSMLQGFTLSAKGHVAQARAAIFFGSVAETAASEAAFTRTGSNVAAVAELAAGSTLAGTELAAPARGHGLSLLHAWPVVATHRNNRLGRGLWRCRRLRRRLRLFLSIA